MITNLQSGKRLNAKVRFQLAEIFYIISFWILALLFFVFLKFSDSSEVALPSRLNDGLSVAELYWIAIYCGLILGAIFSVLHKTIFPRLIVKKSFMFALIVRVLIFTTILFVIIYISRLTFGSGDRHIRLFFKPDLMLLLLVYALAAQTVLDFILFSRRSLGPGYLSELIIGQYYKPREKYCVFMFLDLANSTALAEKLGHLTFSRFLQDCFDDISDVVMEHDAGIYQFVGDEVVLVWDAAKLFSRQKCIALYWDVKEQILSRQSYYNKTYGHLPVFRAAINEGNVVVATVGKVKQEKAYHGDVLNTAARVLSQCKKFNSEILITENFLSNLEVNEQKYFTKVPNIVLEGKKDIIQIYKIG